MNADACVAGKVDSYSVLMAIALAGYGNRAGFERMLFAIASSLALLPAERHIVGRALPVDGRALAEVPIDTKYSPRRRIADRRVGQRLLLRQENYRWLGSHAVTRAGLTSSLAPYHHFRFCCRKAFRRR